VPLQRRWEEEITYPKRFVILGTVFKSKLSDELEATLEIARSAQRTGDELVSVGGASHVSLKIVELLVSIGEIFVSADGLF
jgi:hypothetical protein